MSRNFLWWVMFLMPLPIFISPSSPVLLASGTIGDDALAFPLSFFLLPIAIFFTLKNYKNIVGFNLFLYFWLSLFAIWVLLLSFYSASLQPVALLYALQWCLLFLWGGYFLSTIRLENVKYIVRPFFYGAFIGAAYIFLSGVLEYIIYGALLDAGRVSQNLIFKGQYQLVVYTPTVLAFSFLIVLSFYKANLFSLPRSALVVYFAICFVAIIFTGSREGLLVCLLGGCLVGIITSVRAALVVCFVGLFLLFILYINFDYLLLVLDASEFRALNKIARLADDGAALGARDVMLKIYLQFIIFDPVLGLKMLPPELAYPVSDITIRSAHNLYVDVWAWTGFPGFLALIFFLISLVAFAANSIVRGLLSKYPNNLELSFSWVVLVMLLISNNINVPLRQPVVVPVFLLCVALLALSAKKQQPSKQGSSEITLS